MQSSDLDLLIEEATVHGALTAGLPAPWLAKQSDPRLVAVMASTNGSSKSRSAAWSKEDDQFLRDNLGWLSHAQIAEALGRTVEAVTLRYQRDLRLPSATKREDWLTAMEVARRLGTPDVKSITRLIHRGLLPARMAPLDRDIYLVSIETLTRFAVNPENWIYFKPHRVTDPHLRRLIALRRQRWNDEWWTPGQVATYHGVSRNSIGAQIHRGKLPGKRWGNWWIKRSDATAAKFWQGKGHAITLDWTEAGDEFLVLAKGVGLSSPTVEKLMGWPHNRTDFRFQVMERDGLVADACRRAGVLYNPERKTLWVDWRLYRRRFPRLVRAVDAFKGGCATEEQLQKVVHLLSTWGRWYAPGDAEFEQAKSWRHWNSLTPATARRIYETVLSWGVDPLGEHDESISR